jgi:CRISPR-associated endonuclease Csn1
MLQALTRAHQQAEDGGSARPFERFDHPWPDFRDQVIAMLNTILVARAEERRVSGQTHLDTIRGLDENSQTVFERLSPEKLLDQVKKDAEKSDWKTALEKRFAKPERSQAIIGALLAWQDTGRPNDNPPLGPTGDKIEKIKVISPTGKPAVRVRGGTADRGDMARVDVFSKPTPKGKMQYFLVPIYPHQVAGEITPPCRAVQAYVQESEWPLMDDSYKFEFSLVQKSWIEAVKSDGTVIEGYFRGLNRALGSIDISPAHTLQLKTGNIGARTLHNLSKYQVNRLGTKHLVAKEQRTWRGEVYISGKPPE